MKKLLFQFVLLLTLIVVTTSFAVSQNQSDVEIFHAFMKYANNEGLKKLSESERIKAVAGYFKGKPYIAGSLESKGEEELIINLRGFDCLTFVENVLALNLTIKSENPDFDVFKSKVRFIRYRDGVLRDYTSRLHYTSEWINNNQKKGVFKILNQGTSAVKFPLKVGYMSANYTSYNALKSNPSFVKKMVGIENQINNIVFEYIPKNKVLKVNSQINDGDIIAITTNIQGLDFSHIGFAVKDEFGIVHLLHASSTSNEVVLTDVSLHDYLAGIKKHTGIVICRTTAK